MTETNTTPRCTPTDRVFAVANARLASYIVERLLPHPSNIFAELTDGAPAVIEIWVHGQTRQAAWVASLHVDALSTEPRPDGRLRTSCEGRLPDGTRVRMVGLREAPGAGPELVGDIMRRELTVLHGRREVTV